MKTMVKEAVQYNFSIYNQIHKICEPLENFYGVNLIHYRRFYLKGGLINLFNHSEWMKVSYDNQYWHSSVFQKKLSDLLNKKVLYYLWPEAPIKEDPIYNGLYEHNIWNGITIYKKFEDCIETYAFATTRENSARRNIYFSEIEILEHFILYFRSRVVPLVSEAGKKILIPYQLNLPENLISSSAKTQFLNETCITDFYIRLNGLDIKVSKREEECLSLLCRGKRIKQIASMLGISPRTVEYFVENLKRKTKCRTISQLLLMYERNRPTDTYEAV
jgi:DNA-binding CsgD family transcriptional regulator